VSVGAAAFRCRQLRESQSGGLVPPSVVSRWGFEPVFRSRPGRLATRPPALRASGNGPIARPATGCHELERERAGLYATRAIIPWITRRYSCSRPSGGTNADTRPTEEHRAGGDPPAEPAPLGRALEGDRFREKQPEQAPSGAGKREGFRRPGILHRCGCHRDCHPRRATARNGPLLTATMARSAETAIQGKCGRFR
jgi:hypothetical protein